jgi:hypothetical protein
MISLRKAMEDYLTMRRSLGFKLRDMGHNLRHFVKKENRGQKKKIRVRSLFLTFYFGWSKFALCLGH